MTFPTFNEVVARIDEQRDAYSLDTENNIYPSTGYLVDDGDGRWHVVSDDWETHEVLPCYINNRDSATAFLKATEYHHKEGVKAGREELKRQLGNLLGFAPTWRLDNDVRQLNERMDRCC